MELRRPDSSLITYGTYPFLVAIGAGLIALALRNQLDPAAVAGMWMLVPALILMVIEWRHPLRAEWRMTKQTFWRRDIKFVVAFIAINVLAKPASAFIVVRLMPESSAAPFGMFPMWAQVVAAILFFDLLWYTWHRSAHRFSWLWRAHAAHHSASQLYVVMHLLFHPIDALVIVALQLAAFQLTGISENAAMIVL